MKHLLFFLLAILAISVTVSCGKKEVSKHSAQAQSRALSAADLLVKADTTDTLAIQQALLKAEAIRSEYLTMGDSVAAIEFDKAYREAVAQKNPAKAQEIFYKQQ